MRDLVEALVSARRTPASTRRACRPAPGEPATSSSTWQRRRRSPAGRRARPGPGPRRWRRGPRQGRPRHEQRRCHESLRCRSLRRTILPRPTPARRSTSPARSRSSRCWRCCTATTCGWAPARTTPARDYLVLSKGHGVMAQYACLRVGWLGEDDVTQLRLEDGAQQGPVRRPSPAWRVSSGSLGHGLSVGVGLALAAKRRQVVYSIVGDGEAGVDLGGGTVRRPRRPGQPRRHPRRQRVPGDGPHRRGNEARQPVRQADVVRP
ncbi:MAG: hypothetical protein U0797_01205 [Gemmataceae bacterium]